MHVNNTAARNPFVDKPFLALTHTAYYLESGGKLQQGQVVKLLLKMKGKHIFMDFI